MKNVSIWVHEIWKYRTKYKSINDKKELRDFELPYPFSTTNDETYVKFDYTLENFYQKNSFVEFKTKVFKPSSKNKMLNTTVVLSAI